MNEDGRTLSDTDILNHLELLMVEQDTRFDFAIGKCTVTANPSKPLRPQLEAELVKHTSRLIARKLTTGR
jgi:hypothetical protein